jgi:hypothetical protein
MTIIIPPSSDSTPPTSTPRVKAYTTYSETSPLAVAPESPVSEVPPLETLKQDTFPQSTPVADAVGTVKPSETLDSVEPPLRSLEIEDVPDKPLTAEAKAWIETLLTEKLEGLTEKQRALFLEKI